MVSRGLRSEQSSITLTTTETGSRIRVKSAMMEIIKMETDVLQIVQQSARMKMAMANRTRPPIHAAARRVLETDRPGGEQERAEHERTGQQKPVAGGEGDAQQAGNRPGEGEDENPLVVVWEFGEGRAMAFSTDCSPHWAAYFQPWEYYGQFWRQAMRWLAKTLSCSRTARPRARSVTWPTRSWVITRS